MVLKTSTSNPNSVKQMSVTELFTRIRRGRAWLYVRSSDECIKHGTEYEPTRYIKNLSFYEELVNEVKLRNHTEEEGWNYNSTLLTPEEMTKEEVLFLIDREQVKP